MRLTLSDFAAIAVIVGGCVSFAWFTLDSRIASMEQRLVALEHRVSANSESLARIEQIAASNRESLARIERGLSAPKH